MPARKRSTSRASRRDSSSSRSKKKTMRSCSKTTTDVVQQRNTSVYVSPSYLPNLKNYAYSGKDQSIVGNYIMQHYWCGMVKFLPNTMAPNLVTLIAFIISMSSVCCTAYYYFFENAVYPSWVWYYACFALFTYQTLDAIDGKQARRTGCTGPLGELFDHGCDAFISSFVLFNISCAADFPAPFRVFYYIMISIGLFLTIWEQYSTGTLDLGYINGPTEGVLITCGIFFITGRYGSSIWATPVVDTPFSLPLPLGLTASFFTARDAVLLFICVSAVFTFATNFVHVAMKKKANKTVSASGAFVPMLVAMVFFVVYGILFWEIVVQYPFALEVSFGLLCSYFATRMTVARLCCMPHQPFTIQYFAALVVVGVPVICRASGIDKYFLPSFFSSELMIGRSLVALLCLSVWLYAHLILSLFKDFSQQLKCNILTMTEKQRQNAIERCS